jgi:hypothetical protein
MAACAGLPIIPGGAMRLATVATLIWTIGAGSAWGQSGVPAPAPAATRPIGSLTWLVGGVWRADASTLGPDLLRIETRYRWSDNQAFIRFTTHFVFTQGTRKNYDGQFFWSPATSALAMWYMDSRGAVTEGSVVADSSSFGMQFRSVDFEGKPADLRVSVTRRSVDHYTWALSERAGDDWKELAVLEYMRQSDEE